MRARLWLWSAVTIAPLAALGCQESSGGSAGAAPMASSSAPLSASASASVAPASAKFHPLFARHGGVAASLFRGARDLSDLTETQKDSLDGIETTLKSDDDGIRTAMRAFRKDLAMGVRAGQLDSAKLGADDGAIDKAFADHQSKEADALTSLYALLTPAQRTTLVANVRAKQAEHEARMKEWMQGGGTDAGTQDWTKKRLDKLTSDLSLDAGQQKQVAAILAKPTDVPNGAAMQTRWADRQKKADALLTAFAADAFDPKKLDLAPMPGKTAHEPMDHMVSFYTQLLPVLHPDQRDKLATTVNRPFGADRRGGPGRGAPAAGGGPGDDIAFPFAEPEEVP
jgi:Spy/CpxP family protein refolding chaperone